MSAYYTTRHNSDYLLSSTNLKALRLVILVDAFLGALGVDADCRKIIVVFTCTVDIFLENRLLLDMLELSLEVLQTGSVAAAVGAAAGIGKIEALILNLLTIDTPFLN